MGPRKKRIFWALNHTTLMDVECRLLLDLGFEVYTPKQLGTQLDARSASADYSFDESLSLPADVLNRLNAFNFYQSDFTADIIDILNTHFDGVIMQAVYPLMQNVVDHFGGIILLRVFGREGELTYEELTDISPRTHALKRLFFPIPGKYDNRLMRRLRQIENRFYMAASYREIIEHETGILARRALYLPLGMPQSIWRQENSWEGTENRVMFVCPSIETPYYGQIYREFKQDLGDLPHTIFGKQGGGVDDPDVAGFLDRQTFDGCMRLYRLMFYHSREQRHLHYHPLEAIAFGMPLIFLSGGQLEMLGGGDQPGMAADMDEARRKISLILSGDAAFAEDVREAQRCILDEFRDGYIDECWRRYFLPLFA